MLGSNRYLEFASQAAVFLDVSKDNNLMRVFAISNEELSDFGRKLHEQLSDTDFPEYSIVYNAVWGSQAFVELHDIQPPVSQGETHTLKCNYAFLESVSALRNSVICALNGQVYAALTVLRPTLELFVFHYWWRNRLDKHRDSSDYYEWLIEGTRLPGFSAVVKELYTELNFSPHASTKEDLISIWKKLCAYVHKPSFYESLTLQRGSTVPGIFISETLYWMDLLVRALKCMIDIAICYSPQILFPAPLLRKFGFNYPIGLFFDQSNYIPLKEFLGDELIDMYKNYYHEDEGCKSLFKFVRSREDLTDQEILDSYTDDDIKDDDECDIQKKLMVRHVNMKAKIRALMVGFTYSLKDIKIDYNAS